MVLAWQFRIEISYDNTNQIIISASLFNHLVNRIKKWDLSDKIKVDTDQDDNTLISIYVDDPTKARSVEFMYNMSKAIFEITISFVDGFIKMNNLNPKTFTKVDTSNVYIKQAFLVLDGTNTITYNLENGYEN